MLENALAFKLVLNEYCRGQRIPNVRRLSPAEWAYLETVVAFLGPFKDATLAVSGEKHPSLSVVLPIYGDLFDHINTTLAGLPDESELRGSIKDCSSKLLKYFSRRHTSRWIPQGVIRLHVSCPQLPSHC